MNVDTQLLSRRGMTLVELMVAIALSAMLLGVLVGVLSGIAKQSKLVSKYDQPVWPAEFLSLLRRDLTAADAIWSDKGTIWIRTDAPAYAANNANAKKGMRRIGYGCGTLRDGQAILTRTDVDRQSVLALGPKRIILERLDDLGSPQPLPSAPGPMPEQVRVWIWNDTGNSPVVLRDLVLR